MYILLVRDVSASNIHNVRRKNAPPCTSCDYRMDVKQPRQRGSVTRPRLCGGAKFLRQEPWIKSLAEIASTLNGKPKGKTLIWEEKENFNFTYTYLSLRNILTLGENFLWGDGEGGLFSCIKWRHKIDGDMERNFFLLSFSLSFTIKVLDFHQKIGWNFLGDRLPKREF